MSYNLMPATQNNISIVDYTYMSTIT